MKLSGRHNFEGCRIPIPTAIRYDRLKLSLGDGATPEEQRVLSLLEFGMPINCKPGTGSKKDQNNHYSAVAFQKEVSEYFIKGVKSQALLGPFEYPRIEELRYSPLMSVPKEVLKCCVIVDFFSQGNNGISKTTYLDFDVEFSLPSVISMIDRLNYLGQGCLMYKRDLKSAFRQFAIDPGDYMFTGLSWQREIYVDT